MGFTFYALVRSSGQLWFSFNPYKLLLRPAETQATSGAARPIHLKGGVILTCLPITLQENYQGLGSERHWNFSNKNLLKFSSGIELDGDW